jgi:hypothetical protein
MLWWLNEHGLRRQVAEVAQEAGYGPGGSLQVRPCKLGESHPWLSTSHQHRTRPPELVHTGRIEHVKDQQGFAMQEWN